MIDLLAVLSFATLLTALSRWLFLRMPLLRANRVRRVTLSVSLALLSLLTAGSLALEVSSAREFQTFGTLVHRVDTDQQVIALTFDDGPSRAYTPEIIELLAQEDAKATFFLIGSELEKAPELGPLLLSHGHQLGNHSSTHPRMLGMSLDEIAAQVEQTDAQLRGAGQQGPLLFRSPYGHKLVAVPWYLWRTGRTQVTWDLEPESDPDLAADPERLARYVVHQARPGSILLLHVMVASREQSRRALPLILRGLKQRGFRFVRLDELLELGSLRLEPK